MESTEAEAETAEQNILESLPLEFRIPRVRAFPSRSSCHFSQSDSPDSPGLEISRSLRGTLIKLAEMVVSLACLGLPRPWESIPDRPRRKPPREPASVARTLPLPMASLAFRVSGGFVGFRVPLGAPWGQTTQRPTSSLCGHDRRARGPAPPSQWCHHPVLITVTCKPTGA